MCVFALPGHYFPQALTSNQDEDFDMGLKGCQDVFADRMRCPADAVWALPDYNVKKAASFDGLIKITHVGMGYWRTYDGVYLLLEDVLNLLKAWKRRSEVSEDEFFQKQHQSISLKGREVLRNSVLLFKTAFKIEGSFDELQKRLELTKKRVKGFMTVALAKLMPLDLPLEIVEVICRHLIDANKNICYRADLRVVDEDSGKTELEEERVTEYFCCLGDLEFYLLEILFPSEDKRRKNVPYKVGMQAGILSDCLGKEKRAFLRLISLIERTSLGPFIRSYDGNALTETFAGLWSKLSVRAVFPPVDAGMPDWGDPQFRISWKSLDSHVVPLFFRNHTNIFLVVWNLQRRQRMAWLRFTTEDASSFLRYGSVMVSAKRVALVGQMTGDEAGTSYIQTKQYFLDSNRSEQRLNEPHSVVLRIAASTIEQNSTKTLLVREFEMDRFAVACANSQETRIYTFDATSGDKVTSVRLDLPNLELLDILDSKGLFYNPSEHTICLYDLVLGNKPPIATISIQGGVGRGLTSANFHAIFDPVNEYHQKPGDVFAVFCHLSGNVRCQVHNIANRVVDRPYRSYSFNINQEFAGAWSWKDRVGFFNKHVVVAAPGKLAESCKIYSHYRGDKKLWLYNLYKLAGIDICGKMPIFDGQSLILPGAAFEDFHKRHSAFQTTNNVSRHWCFPRGLPPLNCRLHCFKGEEEAFETRVAVIGADFYVDGAVSTNVVPEDEEEDMSGGGGIASLRAAEKKWMRYWKNG